MYKKTIAWMLVFFLFASIVPAEVFAVSLGSNDSVLVSSYSNGSDFVTYGEHEYFSNLDDKDYLYVTTGAGDPGTLVLEEHVISMVIYKDFLYLLVYREEGHSAILALNLRTLEHTELEFFDGLVSSISVRDHVLYLLKDGVIETINLVTHQHGVLLDEQDISLFYLSEYDVLKFAVAGGGSVDLRSYRFSNGTVTDTPVSSASPLAVYYTPRTTAPATDNPYYTTLNIFHQCGYGMAPNGGNCTCYAFGRSYENLGKEPKLSHGNAGLWYDYNKNNGYYAYGSTPVLGSVVVWKSSGAGHVAVVEIIDGDTVITSESGWQSFYFKTVTRSKSHYNLSASSYYSLQGFIYVLGKDVTDKKECTVTFNANGGNCSTGSKSVTIGSAIGDLPTATRSGYNFDGWYTAATGGNKISSATTFSADTTVYAHWTAHTYTVSFNANGGSGAPANQTKTHNISLQLSSAVPEREDYTFLGWATNSTANAAEYQPGDFYTLNSSVTLYAVWEKDECRHVYSSEVIPATCEDFEKTRFTCTKCGYTYTEYTAAAYSEWATTKPTGVDESLIETKTEYRYSDYQTTTSYEPSMSGWTRVSSEWKQSGTGTVQYVKSWPSGFLTSNSLYSTYNKTPKSASETATDKTTINSDKVSGYLCWHWCRGTYTGGPINRKTSETKSGEFTSFHAFYSTSMGSECDPSGVYGAGSYYHANGSCCKDTYWYYVTPVYTQSYTTYRNLFTYGRWTDWSDWGETVYTGSSTRKVESRTLYRYSEGASAWSEEYPENAGDGLVQTKIQYRYADKSTVTSYEPTIDGYTVVGSSWQQTGAGSMQYVKNWPSGFLTSNSLYSTYNKTPKSASETATDKTTINSDKVSGYLCWHWCRGTYTGGPINRKTSETKSGEFTSFHAFYSTSMGSEYDPSGVYGDGSYYHANGSCCKDTYWYYVTPVYTQTYTTYRNLFTHERWSNWSDWSDTVYTANSSRKVETRSMYRTITSKLGEHEWNSGTVTRDATCTQDGVKAYTCARCGDTKSEVIPKTAHRYEEGYCIACGGVDPNFNFVPVIVTVGNTSGYPGDTVTVPVTISDNAGFAGYTLTILYDEAAMTLTDIRKGAVLNTSDSGAFTKNISGSTINWVDSTNVTGDGELMLLTFQINDITYEGSYEVGLVRKNDDANNFVDENSRAIQVEFVTGNVTVSKKNVQIASGYSGALSWNLTEDGVLTFTGDGKMKNYSYKSEMPWYAYREQIRHVVLEEGVTSIGAYAFYGMPQLESIEIPETVTAIGDYAFKNALLIDNVVLPGELTALGDSAFYACTSLRAIDIPASLWTIKPYTFKNCTALAEVTFHEGNLMKISDGAFYNTALTELVLPDCLTILDTFSFKNCAKLTSIELGSGLTELREAVFYATAIPSIEVPEGITKIGPYVFKNCVKLQTIDLPESLTSVGEASFYACTALKSLELPDNVTKIGNYAFRKCEALRTVNLSEKLQNIGESSFYGCESLYYLAIPDSVSTIQGYAFKGCTELGIVDLGRGVKTLGESAFHTCTGLSEIEIPGSVTKIGDYCFSGSTGIDRITFQGDAPAIGVGAFNKLTATAYYPDGNSTWTAANKLGYGGTITWRAE